MNFSPRAARIICLLLHRKHDPVPLAPVRHIGMPGGQEFTQRSSGSVCRRCGTMLGSS
jgi:hypothetical protein